MKVNFGNVAKSYAKFREDLPNELLASLTRRGINLENKRIADLGSGTGVLTRALQNAGAKVVGVEPSIGLIEEAKEIDKANDHSIQYVNEFSESTSLEANTYDIVTVLRAWHWFDTGKTLLEIKKILKGNGLLLVMDSGFTKQNKIVEETIDILRGYLPNGLARPAGSKANAKQLINSFPVAWFKEWDEHRFDLQETYKFYYDVAFTNEEWCGRLSSLSWLTEFSKNEREQILNKVYAYLNKAYQGVTHSIQHGCYIAVLNLR